MLKTTPVGLLNREAGLTPAKVLLESRQLRYIARPLGLPDDGPARSILPVSFREGDQHTRPGEHTPGNRLWAEPHGWGPWSLGQHLARQLGNILPADPSAGSENARRGNSSGFPGRIIAQRTEDSLTAARTVQAGSAIWSDALRAHAAARALQGRGRESIIQWVPGHAGIEGYEKADEAAKLAASRPYRGWALDPVASRARKPLATRFFQLKSGHAAIGAHLHQIYARESPACEKGDAPTETVHHVLFECLAVAAPAGPALLSAASSWGGQTVRGRRMPER